MKGLFIIHLYSTYKWNIEIKYNYLPSQDVNHHQSLDPTDIFMADSVLVFVSAESLEFNFSPVIEKILPDTVACSWWINHTMPDRNSVISLS